MSGTLDLLLRAMAACNDFERPANNCLGWRTDGEFAPVTLFVNCNDLFAWGCADAEDVTAENIHELEKAVADMLAVDRNDATLATLLFCCRVRKMKPQGAYYKYIDKKFWPLFDACGPERQTGIGNPQTPEQTVAIKVGR